MIGQRPGDEQIVDTVRKRPQDAEQVMTLKVKNDPKNVDVRIQQAGFYFALQRKDQAETVLKSLLAREKSQAAGKGRKLVTVTQPTLRPWLRSSSTTARAVSAMVPIETMT